MYFKRTIDQELLQWRNSTARKPLILRGARQVGKSSAVRNLGKQFDFFIEINFDEQSEFRMLFEKSDSVSEIVLQLSVLTNTPIKEGKTLLFLDEIQASIPAISMLRYFYEKIPNLHVIAAGSLLEFALAELPSFGVGRVRSIFVYPFSFEEFLMALNENQLLDALRNANPKNHLPIAVHNKLISFFKKFLVIGGMPEAVQVFVAGGDLLEVGRVLDDLVISIQADFSKYKNRVPSDRIKTVFESVVQQTGFKFQYASGNTGLSNIQTKQVLDLLEMAGLIYTVTHTAGNGIPLGADINEKKRKFLIFDTGIFQRILGLDIGSLLISDEFNLINKGNLAELHVGLEMLKSGSSYRKQDLYYWQREAKNSQAEVDYIIQQQEQIIPIEVKAGTKGSMQSMFLFLEEKKCQFGIRLAIENFSAYDKVKVFPLYAVQNIFKH
jgi:predicted AAA+ superfamily ATPase